MATKTHLLCYIRRDHLTSWKLHSLKGRRLVFGSDDGYFRRFAKKANVLWIVSGSPDAPPSLEAKIEIAGQLHKNKVWKCEVRGTTAGSNFFGLNDASEALMQLVFENNKKPWSLRDKCHSSQWKNCYAWRFQAPRRIAPSGKHINQHYSSGAAPLEQLARRAKARCLFISWKHTDKGVMRRRRFLRSLTAELTRRGFSVWWDKTALSNASDLNKHAKKKRDEMMKGLLAQGLSQTKLLLAFCSENYGVASSSSVHNWTQHEWLQLSNGKRIALVPGAFASKPNLIGSRDRMVKIPKNPDVERIAMRIERISNSLL